MRIAHSCGHNILQNIVNYTFKESRYVKDYEDIKLVNLSSCWAAQLSLVLDMISENTDFGGRGM